MDNKDDAAVTARVLTPPVFLSYARRDSTAAVQAVQEALPGKCFVDSSDIGVGDVFPEHIVDALLGCRVVVVFASEGYFQRWYCLWELRTLLGPYEAHYAAGRSGAAPLEHVVVVLPDGKRSTELDRLPPSLQQTNWLGSGDTEGIARLIRERLQGSIHTLRERYSAVGRHPRDVRASLLDLTALPPPADLSVARIHYGLDTISIQDDFVGRADDLHRVDFWLRTLRGEPGTAAPIVTIEGLGGIGKTRLAAEYVHRFGARFFPGGIIWIDAGKELEPQFHGALETLESATPEFQSDQWSLSRQARIPHRQLDPLDRMQMRLEAHAVLRDPWVELRKLLSTRSTQDAVLWVVDNVPEVDGEAGEFGPPPSLSTYCPALGQVAALMTSRRRLSLEPGRRGIVLREPEPEAAVRILTREVPSVAQIPPGSWKALSNLVGRLPLALTLLNQVLLSGYSPAALLKALQTQATTAALDQQAEALRSQVEPGALRGVTEALSISYESLSPAAREAAHILATLAPATIPTIILDSLPEAFPLEVRRQLTGRSFVTMHEALASSALAVPSFGSMHRILADYLRTHPLKTENALSQACRAVSVALSQSLSAWREQWHVFEACLVHAVHLLQSNKISVDGRHIEGAESLNDLPPDARAALWELLEVISSASSILRRGSHEAAHVLKGAVELYRWLARVDPDAFEPKLATLLIGYSGHTAGRSNEEGLRDIQEAVDIHRRLSRARPAEFKPKLAETLEALYLRLLYLERHVDALEAIRGVVEIRQRLATELPDEFEPKLADSLRDLARTLGELGKRAEALEATGRAVEVFRSLSKKDLKKFGPDLAMSLNNLAVLLNGSMRREEALESIKAAAQVYAALAESGPDSYESGLAGALNNQSIILKAMGRQEEADSVAQEAFRLHARNRPDI